MADLEAIWAEHRTERDRILAEDLAAFNLLFTEHQVPAVVLPSENDAGGEEDEGDAAGDDG